MSSVLVCLPWELLYSNDLVLTMDTLQKCISKFKAQTTGLDCKGLHVNMKKTKFLVSGVDLDVLKSSGKYSCAVCISGVGNNSIHRVLAVQAVGQEVQQHH